MRVDGALDVLVLAEYSIASTASLISSPAMGPIT